MEGGRFYLTYSKRERGRERERERERKREKKRSEC